MPGVKGRWSRGPKWASPEASRSAESAISPEGVSPGGDDSMLS
jgi:hypothetical protein